jgi:outer membrane lipoprotein carrier protein
LKFPSWIALAFLISAGATAQKRELPKPFPEIEARYRKAVTMKANFEQTTESAVTKVRKTTAGTLWFKQPGRLKWDTTRPSPELLISDGKTFWHYTPPFDPADPSEKGQVIVRDAKKVGSKLAELILAGRFSGIPGFSLKKGKDGAWTFTPSKEFRGENVQTARLWVDEKNRVVDRVEIRFKSGNFTDLRLNGVVLGEEIPDREFTFDPPPKTDIVRE